MKVSYKVKKGIYSYLTLGLGLAVVFSFQNCSDLDNSDVLSLSDVEREALLDLPFAYDLKIDQMAYMSCSGESAKQDARSFTLKAGGYSVGSGVALRPNFLSAISNLNTDTKARSLSFSERNDQAGVVMSLRPRNDLQNYLDPVGENGEIPISQMMFREAQGLLLSNERVAKQLVALGPGSYLNYVSGLPGLVNKSFDGQVRIATDSSLEDFVRNLLKNSYYMAFNYAEPLAVQPEDQSYILVRSPYNTTSGDSRAQTSVFGLGYMLNFQQFDATMPTTPPRAMTVSNTVNLENSSFVAEQWDCSEKFIIVRPEDAGRPSFDLTPGNPSDGSFAQVCDTRSDTIPANNTERLRWERIRNILPVEDWYVNLPCPATGPAPVGCTMGLPKPGCIVPKGNDFCYDMNELNPTDNLNVRVSYYRGEDLDSTTPIINYNGSCGPGTLFICPHVVTLCYKR